MYKYRFDTKTTMKPYNEDKYWIDARVVPPIIISAETLEDALEQWRELVEEKTYSIVQISKNALRSKEPMYRDLKSGDAEQIGYVITGATEIIEGVSRWSKQYIDLWLEINVLTTPDFKVA